MQTPFLTFKLPYSNAIVVTLLASVFLLFRYKEIKHDLSADDLKLTVAVLGALFWFVVGISQLIVRAISRVEWASRLLVVISLAWLLLGNAILEPFHIGFEGRWVLDNRSLIMLMGPLLFIWGEVWVLKGITK